MPQTTKDHKDLLIRIPARYREEWGAFVGLGLQAITTTNEAYGAKLTENEIDFMKALEQGLWEDDAP